MSTTLCVRKSSQFLKILKMGKDAGLSTNIGKEHCLDIIL